MSDDTALTKRSFNLVFAALLLSVFAAAADQTVLAVVLDTIRADLHDGEMYTWAATAYLLCAASFAPLYGKMADILGRKASILFALFTFSIGSLACSVSPSMIWLIIARAVQGVGGGGVMQLVRIIVADLTNLRDRGVYIGLVSATWGISSSLGGLLGGLIVSMVSWRFIFAINAPICLTAAWIIQQHLNIPMHNEKPWRTHAEEFDTYGLILLVGGSAIFLLGCTLSTSGVSATSGAVLILGIVVLVGAAYNEMHTSKSALIPPAVFRQRTSASAMLINGFHALAFMAAVYYLPLYFEIIGHTPYQAGLRTIPFAFGASLTSTAVGFLLQRLPRYRNVMAGAMLVMCVGFGLLCLLRAKTPTFLQELIVLIPALGVGPNWTLPMLILQTSMSKKDLATATAGFGLLRSLMGAAGVAIGGALYSGSARRAILRIPNQDATVKNMLVDKSVDRLRTIAPFALRDQVIGIHVDAIRVVWLFCIPLLVISLVVTFCIPGSIGQEKGTSSDVVEELPEDSEALLLHSRSETFNDKDPSIGDPMNR